VSPKQHSPSGRIGASAEAGPSDVTRIVSYTKRLSLIHCTHVIALLDEATEVGLATKTTQALIVGGRRRAARRRDGAATDGSGGKGVGSTTHVAPMGRKRNFRGEETCYTRHLSSTALPHGTVSGPSLSVPF